MEGCCRCCAYNTAPVESLQSGTAALQGDLVQLWLDLSDELGVEDGQLGDDVGNKVLVGDDDTVVVQLSPDVVQGS